MIYNPVLAKGDSRAFKSFSVYLFEMIKITVGIMDSNRNELEIDSRMLSAHSCSVILYVNNTF